MGHVQQWKYQIQRAPGIVELVMGNFGWEEFRFYGRSFTDHTMIVTMIHLMSANKDDAAWRLIKWPIKGGRWVAPGSVKVLMEGTVAGEHIAMYPEPELHSRVDNWYPKNGGYRRHHKRETVSLADDLRADPKNRALTA